MRANKCHWCEGLTGNQLERVLNGNGEWKLVVFCRDCVKATEEMGEMACESDKCEKYGMHHDYENGIEVRKCGFCQSDATKTLARELEDYWESFNATCDKIRERDRLNEGDFKWDRCAFREYVLWDMHRRHELEVWMKNDGDVKKELPLTQVTGFDVRDSSTHSA